MRIIFVDEKERTLEMNVNVNLPNGLCFDGLHMHHATFHHKKINRASFVSSYLEGSYMRYCEAMHVNFTGANLGSCDLENARLCGSIFRNCIMQGCFLEGADLSGANLAGASMKYARFKGSDLRGAILLGQNMEEASFEGASFDRHTIWPSGFDPLKRGAILEENKMSSLLPEKDIYVSFINEKAEEAQMCVSRTLVGTPFDGMCLHRANFKGMVFDMASFVSCDLQDADLRDARASDVDFSSTLLVGVQAAGANLWGALLHKSRLQHTNFENANLSWADLSGAEINDVSFVSCDLRGATMLGNNLENSLFTSAKFDKYTVWPEGFNPLEYGAVQVAPEKEYESRPIRLERFNLSEYRTIGIES